MEKTMVKGLYVHRKEGMWNSSYTIANLEFEAEGPMTIVQHDNYVLLQAISEEGKNLPKLYLFKDGKLCMRGRNFKKLNKEEMHDEIMWCIEQYKYDLKKYA